VLVRKLPMKQVQKGCAKRPEQNFVLRS